MDVSTLLEWRHLTFGQNVIANLKAVSRTHADGADVVIVIGVTVRDACDAEAFVQFVADRFVSMRMCSPPNTDSMLVTILGDLSSFDFARIWSSSIDRSELLKFFMSQMKSANAVHASEDGSDRVLDSTSLLLV